MRLNSNILNFIFFAIISLCGWFLDFISFLILTNYADLTASYSNFISSYVGVTFVWFIALGAVFKTKTKSNNKYLFIYWAYQFISILFYSYLIIYFQYAPEIPKVAHSLGIGWQVIAKIVMTPFNLVTNYMFMHLLTFFIKKRTAHV